MNAIAQDSWQEQEDDPVVNVDGRIDFQLQDAYWESVYWTQPHYRSECSYEQDYAPAYCVGYIGYAQYGGAYEDAEKCLCANWVRIKGDSRLTLDEALQAIRSAWQHAAEGQLAEEEDEPVADAGYVAQATAQAARRPAYAEA